VNQPGRLTRRPPPAAVVFAYDYHPASHTLYQEHFIPRPPTVGRNGRFQPQDMHVPERIVWSYAVQLASALKRIHDEGLAARVVDPSKILVTGRNRCVNKWRRCSVPSTGHG
jgi:PAB-dependent poly(A)-specific ribonuclease subunit 3